MAAVTCFEVWVETAAVRQTTTLTQDFTIADDSLSLGELGSYDSVRLSNSLTDSAPIRIDLRRPSHLLAGLEGVM